ncbi:MerR family transcriptional regulator [Pelagicoccus mobilis]|uniref:MerR family transcriptional regulator n=1 Tax=Pelagicoccus mobilis TaxID=415221 RepID=A0A934RXM3_9BACT|nr:MerR family transcriptional regulator [Pelagicoccus mobilis]MBK1879610.1 MerR family transcriptional regulator [Pelagicoccus mobilis]
MLTIRELARRHGLSRSTLLYYDDIGLLPPTTRTGANYRLYDEQANSQLTLIRAYREAGLPLEIIATLINKPKSRVTKALNQRLSEINREIQALRQQQSRVVSMLKNSLAFRRSRYMDKNRWVELLRESGLSDEDMMRWHQTFEEKSPEAHQDFLESIGIAENEIRSIRQKSRSTESKK